MPPLTSLAELGLLARDPGARSAISALGGTPFLLLDLTGDAAHAPYAALLDWLRALPGPSIAVGSGDGPWAAACDARVATLAEAESLVAGIRRTPLAATVLVQLLRASEGLPLEAALFAESLAYSTLQTGPEFGAWLRTHRAPEPLRHRDLGPAVLIERESGVLRLRLNRPSLRNGMSVEMRDALIEALQLVLADDSLESVSLGGEGKCFSTGGDLSEFGTAPDPATAHLVRSLALPGRLLAACAPRTTVRLHGACVGSGIEFPAFAGRLVATPDAWFQLPELKFGLIPGAGGTVSIARRIGRQRLAGWVLSGRRIDAATALAWGLVDAIED
ncbi:enoyl-CoA hydratase/isomerase family protein [Stagnimonas aquatica]|uniref:Enoyl-CoA hydratase/isomerase family protein n=2 Tax=Stagnimonas aquatica TaxID=2689987 RepID=A0A3N0VM81_9GAMM|nr:enoyl-CoA hydratase/isomerase family protein [Stagnimonas aquatica]